MPAVLVIEGNAELRSQLVRVLGGAGFAVSAAEDGAAAAKLLRLEEPDVILVEPGAREPAAMLAELRRCVADRVPIVLMTSVNDTMMPVRFRVPVIHKPNFDGLVPTVRYYAGRKARALDAPGTTVTAAFAPERMVRADRARSSS